MGIGPIPHSKIERYGRRELSMSGDRLDVFSRLIRFVDGEYLSIINGSSANNQTTKATAPIGDDKAVLQVFGFIESANRSRRSSGRSKARKSN